MVRVLPLPERTKRNNTADASAVFFNLMLAAVILLGSSAVSTDSVSWLLGATRAPLAGETVAVVTLPTSAMSAATFWPAPTVTEASPTSAVLRRCARTVTWLAGTAIT